MKMRFLCVAFIIVLIAGTASGLWLDWFNNSGNRITYASGGDNWLPGDYYNSNIACFAQLIYAGHDQTNNPAIHEQDGVTGDDVVMDTGWMGMNIGSADNDGYMINTYENFSEALWYFVRVWTAPAADYTQGYVPISPTNYYGDSYLFKAVSSGPPLPTYNFNFGGEDGFAADQRAFEYTGDTGHLQVTLTPTDVVNSGAQWSAGPYSRQDSGIILEVATGNYALAFTQVSGWNAPSSTMVNVYVDQTTSIITAYTKIPPTNTPNYVNNDFDGDGLADIVVYGPAEYTWWYRYSSFAADSLGFGIEDSFAVPGDFDGDTLADTGIYKDGRWYIILSSTGLYSYYDWGWSGTIPVQADYDGDGYCDPAVYWPKNGNWYIRESSNGQARVLNWGWQDVIPVPADYDGDGRTDVAVYHAAAGNWYVLKSRDGYMLHGGEFNWGWQQTLPVPADYDGDGRADIAVYQPSGGQWYVHIGVGQNFCTSWGWSDAFPVPADYDGDGKTDVGVYNARKGQWFIQRSSDGGVYNDGPVNWGWKAVTPVLRQYQILRGFDRVP
jgi:hypothetical protein